jgi:DNA polymerase-1
MCSRTTASRSPVNATIPCWSPTCSTASRRATTWTRRRKISGHQDHSFRGCRGKGAKQITFNQVDVDRAAEYAAEDADVTLQLHQALWPQLEAEPRLKTLYETIEQPLVPVLYRMERTGVLVDAELLAAQSSELAARMLELQAQAHIEAGGVFNVDSPKQLQEILFGKLGFRSCARRRPASRRRPKTCSRSWPRVSAAEIDPGISRRRQAQIDLHRQAAEQIDPRPGAFTPRIIKRWRPPADSPRPIRICRTFRSARRKGGASARPSSRRRASSLVAADYSQIELRIMAHLSGDASCCSAFAEDRDVHQATAAEVFGVALGEVSADQRRSAKAINFGLIYGMSAFGLARQLGIGRGEAQKYMDLYFERYPGREALHGRDQAAGARGGFVETVFGRRLYLPEIQSRNAALRQYAERSAINAPMQGTAADIIKRAMIDVDAVAAELRVCRRGSSCRCTTNSSWKSPTRRSGWSCRKLRGSTWRSRGDTGGAPQSRRRDRPQLGRGALGRPCGTEIRTAKR